MANPQESNTFLQRYKELEGEMGMLVNFLSKEHEEMQEHLKKMGKIVEDLKEIFMQTAPQKVKDGELGVKMSELVSLTNDGLGKFVFY